ncbi:hypothetical protein BC834DRAFT_496200 [Gloeopeniophorella convolvens]|nr:hypothetical protein BC834DRAFT_496200 [Gloeopeniophorella convolvens]
MCGLNGPERLRARLTRHGRAQKLLLTLLEQREILKPSVRLCVTTVYNHHLLTYILTCRRFCDHIKEELQHSRGVLIYMSYVRRASKPGAGYILDLSLGESKCTCLETISTEPSAQKRALKTAYGMPELAQGPNPYLPAHDGSDINSARHIGARAHLIARPTADVDAVLRT